MIVFVVLGLAAVAVLGAVVLLAMGRGGELSATRPDHPPLPLGAEGWPVSVTDAMDLRLPRTLWGYQPDLADEAVRRLTRALADHEAEIAALRRENAELRHRAGDPVGALYGLRETSPNAAPSGEIPPDAGDPHDTAPPPLSAPSAASGAGATSLDHPWDRDSRGDDSWGGDDRWGDGQPGGERRDGDRSGSERRDGDDRWGDGQPGPERPGGDRAGGDRTRDREGGEDDRP